MHPQTYLKSTLRWLSAAAFTASLALAAGPAMAQDNNNPFKVAPQNNEGPADGMDELIPGDGGGDPDPKITKMIFTKTGTQLGCKHVGFRIRLAVWGTENFFDDPNADHVKKVTDAVQDITDQLPKGLSWTSVNLSGDIQITSILAYNTTVHEKDTFSITGLKYSPDNKDGIGDDDMREWNIIAIAKIDPAEFAAPKTIENQAKIRISYDGGVMEGLSHNPALPDPLDWWEGQPTKVDIDLTDCDDPEDGGEPEGEPCIKIEKGEVECNGVAGPFVYKMPVGPELAGTTIELTSLTPGVVVNPAFQVVPVGGGILEWDLLGAAPGMVINLLTNNVKLAAGPDIDGLAICCTEEIEIIIPDDIPCDEEEADLEVKKIALVEECDKELGDCKFRIRTKNVGGAPFTGELVLDEWQMPEKADLTNPPNAPWTCNIPLGLDHYVCKHPEVTLNPGEFKDLLLDFKPGAMWIGDEIKNCARFNYAEAGIAPFGDLTNDKSCAKICIKGEGDCQPEEIEGQPKLLLKKFNAGTVCEAEEGPCTISYSIIIHNFGDGDFNGALTVTDTFEVKPDLVQFTPIPPWVCATVDGKKFDCSNPGEFIAANAQIILTVKATFNNPGDMADKEIENCAKLAEAEDPDTPSCDSGALPGPADEGKPDLTLQKVCKPGVLGGLVDCRISITNNGVTTPTRRIRIFDNAKILGTSTKLQPAELKSDGEEFKCLWGGEKTANCLIDGRHLPPGTTRYFDASFQQPQSASARYENCARAYLENVVSRERDQIGEVCVQGGVDIRVEKTGEGTCAIDDNECLFNVTIKNEGEGDFDGKVKFVDALGLAGEGMNVPITSINPPLPCDVQPTSVPFVCEGNLNLAKGDSKTYAIGLNFSAANSVPEGAAMRNCAVIVDGDLGADAAQPEPQPKNADGANVIAGVVGCHPFELGGTKKDQCEPPLVMNSQGQCVCPEGTKWNGRRCVGDDIPPPVVDPLCKIGKGEIRTRDNRCICRKGFIRKGPGLCVPPEQGCTPGPNEYKNRKGQCLCKKGFDRNNYGICVNIPQGCKPGLNEIKNRKGECVCKKGYTRNRYGICLKTPQGCTPGRNEVKNSKGQCVCKKGFTRNNKGFCVKPPQGCKPGPNEYKDQKGNCLCKRGYDRNNYGICVRVPQGCTPGRNEVKNSKGQCVCKPGYQRSNKGFCVKIPQGCKGPNEIKDSKGNCVCKRGYDRNNYGICMKVPQGCTPGRNEIKNSKGQCVCKPGYQRSNKGACVKIPQGCKGPNEIKNSTGRCVCKQGYSRNRYKICMKNPDPKPTCKGGSLIKRGKGWFCSCPKGWTRKPVGKAGGATCTKPFVAPKPPCKGGSLIKRGKGWFCSCPKGWTRKPVGKAGGATCTKPAVISQPKPPCYSGRLLKRGKGWYCACPKNWKRTPIGNKGGARCTLNKVILKKPVVKKPVLKKPIILKKKP